MTVAQPCPDAGSTTRPGAVELPLLAAAHRPGRLYTCRYRCGDACARPVPNRSENEYFGAVLQRAISRRGALRAGAVITLAVGSTGALAACTTSPAVAPAAEVTASGLPRGLDYATVPVNNTDGITLPPGYASNVVIRWGDPVVPGAPEFDFANQTPEAQAQQFGYNNDFCGVLPLDGDRLVMFNNHEYSIEPLMFPGYDEENPTETQVRIGMAAHGLSVHVVERDPATGEMRAVLDPLNRRYTATSEFLLTGPAAGSALLQTSADPTGTRVLGTLNNCAGGVTPWGTFLSGEENFNQYFANAASVVDPAVLARAERYGITEEASERKWERFDPRFDMLAEPNEPNRFGWIVEVDPQDPTATPVKRTALGRFKHEGATTHLAADGRAVAYMGDDERFDYVYKFVSDRAMQEGGTRAAREANATLLDDGTLYVARFTGDSPAAEITGDGAVPADGAFDGAGEWIKLAAGTESFVPGMSAEEVYVFTRQAADLVGATKMDRPEDVEANPVTGRVYVALTNNTDRGTEGKAGPDEANPRTTNAHGHVLELEEDGGDAAAPAFAWRILLVCGDPDDPGTYFAGFDKSQVSPITSPDNLAFDGRGNLWISTDSGRALELPGTPAGINDGLYGVSLEGPTRGRTALFASVPNGAECCGPVVTDEFVLISPQHPGDLDGASPETPQSTWPDGPGSQPRPSVVNIWREGASGPGRIGE
ncbi:PhoX family phosphatase [Pseudonocardia sp. KRD-184]|uniref:PhoX family phosphatase n=1 Tax=Pseudonocardia oceani TaxID=2792013 RepID=A0ABS6U630_9PSEU|nr:PhoX family phosphatase [Pseudonocardia oceani]MBW0100449.1 PhoX family phosphatase [Pseudonocardia oceani]MBW0113216.1 PhoX family phosphatase [Pseudonocardia oceani]MBW0125950.1 PhoX family phosphatase [Pseudonocardia oceani]MBW0127688.1 PhoX family phosphatase [Pseudonocardia oceani]